MGFFCSCAPAVMAARAAANTKISASNVRPRLGRGSVISIVGLLVRFLLLFFVFFVLLDTCQLQRLAGYDLEVAAALGTGDDLSLFHFIFFNVNIAFALGTKDHAFSTIGNPPLLT